MSDAAMAEAERVLREREKETPEELKSLKESTAPSPVDGSVGRLTYIDAHQQHQMILAGQRRLEIQLARIAGALARVRARTYGVCPLCRGAIPAGRLEASLKPRSAPRARSASTAKRAGDEFTRTSWASQSPRDYTFAQLARSHQPRLDPDHR